MTGYICAVCGNEIKSFNNMETSEQNSKISMTRLIHYHIRCFDEKILPILKTEAILYWDTLKSKFYSGSPSVELKVEGCDQS